MTNHIDRKILKKPDVILARLRGGYQWAQNNIRSVVILMLAILVVAAIWIISHYFLNKKQAQAFTEFYQAEKIFDKRKTENIQNKKTNLINEMKQEVKDFREAFQPYSRSHAAVLGYLKLGDFFTEQQSYTEAISSYEKALEGDRHLFYRLLIYYNLGYLYELSGQYEKAMEYFQKITAFNKKRILFWTVGQRPNSFWLSSAYFGIGRCQEKLNRFSEAKEMYLRIVDEFPETPFSDKAEALALLLPSKQQ